MDGNTTDGLLELDVSTIDIQYGLGVGANGDTGQIGQVLSSGGADEPMRWVSNGVIGNQNLTQSTNITISPDGFYDGTTASTISASLPSYTAGSGIEVSPTFVISANTDEDTITNTGGTGTQLSVLKVPHKLTITKIDNTTIEFDGSADKSIDLGGGVSGVPPIYVGEQGGANAVSLSFSTTTLENIGANPVELSVKKVPQTLTITQGGVDTIFDGSVAKTLTITDNNTEYTATLPLVISNSDVISLDKDSTLTTLSDKLSVVKVPNSLTIIRQGVSTAFDGQTAETITINDVNTEYTATLPLLISNSDVISLDKDSTLTTLSDKLSVVKVPNALSITTGGTTTTFDGSTAKSLTIPNGSDTLYSATDPISKTTSGTEAGSFGLYKDETLTLLPNIDSQNELSVVKVPNQLSITYVDGSNTNSINYDGSSAEGITLTNTDTTYGKVAPITLSTPTPTNDGGNFGLDYDTNTLKLSSQKLAVKKVPNALSITQSGTTTTFDGESAESITINDDNTEYTATLPLVITESTTPDISLNKDSTLTTLSDNLSVVKVPNKLVAGQGISMNVAGGYDGSITTTISSSEPSKTQNYAWRGSAIEPIIPPALTSAPKQIQLPKSDEPNFVYYKLYLNGSDPSDNPTGSFVEMDYTMPIGSRYFKITLDFSFYINPLFANQSSGLYLKWYKEIGGVSTELDYQPALVSSWRNQDATAVVFMRHSSQSFIFDIGSTLTQDTAIKFRPEMANLRLSASDIPNQGSTTNRPIYITLKNTNLLAFSSGGANELTGTITNLGNNFIIGT